MNWWIIWWLLRRHYLRLLSMAAVFAIVMLVIVIVDQIVLNIDQQIQVQTKPLVWADMLISSSQVISGGIRDTLNTQLAVYGWEYADYIQFYTTVWVDGVEPKLVKVIGAHKSYPRYGKIEVNSLLSSVQWFDLGRSWVYVDAETFRLVWGDESKIWNMITLWDTQLAILGIITDLPSAGVSLFDEGRIIIMPYNIISDTKLVEFGSRVEHQIQVRLDRESDATIIKQVIEDTYGEEYKVDLAQDRVQQLSSLTQQLDQYTSIIIIVVVILSLMMMRTAIMTMTWTVRHSIAVMRILGLTRIQTSAVSVSLYASMFVIGSILWVLWWWAIFQLLWSYEFAQDFIWSWSVLWTVWWVVLVSFVIACWQPLQYLVMTPPLDLLRSQDTQQSHRDQLIGIWLLVWWSWMMLALLTGAWWFSMMVTVVMTTVVGLGYWILMLWFGWLRRAMSSYRLTQFWWYDAIRQTVIPGNQTWLLVGGIVVSLVSFCVIVGVSLSLLERLDITAADQPNLFVLNVRNQDIKTIKTLDPASKLYDTILARISMIKGQALSQYLDTNLDNKARQWEYTREFNITSVNLDSSPVIQGEKLMSWWISLDAEFADWLWLWVGDRMSLLIQGREFDLTITNLRDSVRSGAEPFFYMQIDAEQFTQAPRTWFWVTRQQDSQLTDFKNQALNQIWGHLSFVDVGKIVWLVTEISRSIIAVIIWCMAIIILLIIALSITNNEASALISKSWYRLYYILGMTESDLRRKISRMMLLYVWVIMIWLVIITPLSLYGIYQLSSLLSWSWSAIRPMLWWVILTIMMVVLSYVIFHRRIITEVVRSNTKNTII